MKAQKVSRVRDVVRLTAQRFFVKEAISDNDREIIAKHGGDVWVEPRENGNSFILTTDKESKSAPEH